MKKAIGILSCILLVMFCIRTGENLNEIRRIDICEFENMNVSQRQSSVETAKEKIFNPYFFAEDVMTVKYNYTVRDDSGEEKRRVQKQMEMSVCKEMSFDHGILYNLLLEDVSPSSNSGMGVQGKKCFSLGYFYVQAEKIYLIRDMEIKADIIEEDLVGAGVVICLPESQQEDYFTRSTVGWHEFIWVKDGKCTFYSYNDDIKSGFYECFVWQNGRGLTEYYSGYGENEKIKLWMEEAKQTGISNDENDNPYFFLNNITKVEYIGNFEFYSVETETGGIGSEEIEVELSVKKEKMLENGILYSMEIINDGKFQFADSEIGERDQKRLNLGYFYVQAEKIYLIRDMKIESDITEKELIDKGKIICQPSPREDIMDSDEKGWHEYIKIIGDRCEFCSYANFIETDWWEVFVWQKELGLIEYRSGRGAGRDRIDIMMKL